MKKYKVILTTSDGDADDTHKDLGVMEAETPRDLCIELILKSNYYGTPCLGWRGARLYYRGITEPTEQDVIDFVDKKIAENDGYMYSYSFSALTIRYYNFINIINIFDIEDFKNVYDENNS